MFEQLRVLEKPIFSSTASDIPSVVLFPDQTSVSSLSISDASYPKVLTVCIIYTARCELFGQ